MVLDWIYNITNFSLSVIKAKTQTPFPLFSLYHSANIDATVLAPWRGILLSPYHSIFIGRAACAVCFNLRFSLIYRACQKSVYAF